jgi:hypothetical protein
VASLPLAVKAEQERAHYAQPQAKLALEASIDRLAVQAEATAAGDARRLRGLPGLARGVSGAIPGTAPHEDAPSLRVNGSRG